MIKLTLFLAIFLTLALVLTSDHPEEQAQHLEGDVKMLQLRGAKKERKIKKPGQRRKKKEKSRSFSRIVGGTEAGEGEFPWHAVIKSREPERLRNPYFCGAVVIDQWHILTAAHCVADRGSLPCYNAPTKERFLEIFDEVSSTDAPHYFDVNSYKRCRWIDPMDIRVYAGITNLYSTHTYKSRTGYNERPWRYVDRIFVTEEFFGSAQNDIAVLLLQTPFEIGSVQFARLPTPDLKLNPGTPLTVTGFGRRDADRPGASDQLIKAEVEVFPTEQCPYSGTYKKFCAGRKEGGVDSCQGDSGGPIGIDRGDENFTVVGIVSYGYGCGLIGYPGVYAEVRYFLDFIEKARNGAIEAVTDTYKRVTLYG